MNCISNFDKNFFISMNINLNNKENLNNNINIKNTILKEFFNLIIENLSYKYGSISNLNSIIKKIIEQSNNLLEIINIIVSNLINIFNNYLNKQNFNINLNNQQNYLFDNNNNKNINFNKNNIENILISHPDELNSTTTLKDLNLKNCEIKNFSQIIKKLNLFKSFEFLMKNRERSKILNKYKVIQGKKGLNFIIPTKDKKYYIFRAKNYTGKTIFVSCCDSHCLAKGKIRKFDYQFFLVTEHNIKFEEHKYYEKVMNIIKDEDNNIYYEGNDDNLINDEIFENNCDMYNIFNDNDILFSD